MMFNKSLIALALCAAPAFGKKNNLRKGFSASGSIKTDGELEDWDINSDFVGDMLIPASDAVVAAKTYAKWNCATSTICVLVLGEFTIDQDTDNEWIKDGTDLIDPDRGFSWVQATCGMPIGFEACFGYEEAGLHDEIEIQASYNNGNITSITTSLDLSCAVGSSTGCGADGVCGITKGESIAQSRRSLQVDPCAKNPDKSNKAFKGWDGEKVRKPGCSDTEPKKWDVCGCTKTYDELRAMDICKGQKIPVCHRTGETICMPEERWQNSFCKQHPGALCGVCDGDDGTNARHGKYNNGKPQWKKGWWKKNMHKFQ